MTRHSFQARGARILDTSANWICPALHGDERRLTALLVLLRLALLALVLVLLPVVPDVEGQRVGLAVIWAAAWLPTVLLQCLLARLPPSRVLRTVGIVLDVGTVNVLLFTYPELTLPAVLGLMLLVGLHAFRDDLQGGLVVTAVAAVSLALERAAGKTTLRIVDLVAFVLVGLATSLFVGQGARHQRRSVRGLQTSYARARDDLALALETSATGLWSWDPETGEVEAAGELLSIFGVDRADPDAMKSHIHPEDMLLLHDRLQQLLADGGSTDVQFRIVLDHRTRWVVLHGRAVTDPESGKKRLMGTATDITEQHEQQAQWDRARQLQTVSGLAGGVAHDFNNLLAVITMSAEVLRRSSMDEVQAKRVEFILGAAHRGAALSSRLLSLARSEPGNPKTLLLDELLHGIEPMLRQALRDDISLTVSVPHRLPSVIADGTLLEQALLNVALNARDAIPGTGSVVVSVRHEVAGGDPPTRPNGTVVIEIEDDGIGMTDEVRERALEPFFTTKAPGRGTGLGLASVLATVSAVDGDVRIDSAPGRGTRVRLHIPAARERRHADRPREQAMVTEPGATILVVDDDALRKALGDLLSAMGYHVLLAAGGREALALFPRPDDAPVHVVVTDVVMPELSGPDLVKHLQLMGVTVPIVYMTGYVDQHSHQLPAAARVLHKPFNTDELLDCLNVALVRTA